MGWLETENTHNGCFATYIQMKSISILICDACTILRLRTSSPILSPDSLCRVLQDTPRSSYCYWNTTLNFMGHELELCFCPEFHNNNTAKFQNVAIFWTCRSGVLSNLHDKHPLAWPVLEEQNKIMTDPTVRAGVNQLRQVSVA